MCYVLPALEKKVHLLWLGEGFSGFRFEPVAEDAIALLSVLTHLLLACCALLRGQCRGLLLSLWTCLFLHMRCSSDVVSIHLGLLCIVDVLALTQALLILINVCMI